jgi:DNA-binding protein HU-beta
MTKRDFVDAVAERTGMSKREAGAAVDAMLDTITDALKDGDSITFTGFGKFSTSARAARMGVNPRTGEKVHIAATTVPKFSAGSALKEVVTLGFGRPPGKPVPPKPPRPKPQGEPSAT